MPDDIARAIGQAYAALGVSDLAVAVRSSATAEDLPEMSFAGQQETYLNRHGEVVVLDAVKRCWASLWTARAIGYRARHGITPEDVSLAVVVQEMVPAEAAGILFTANPLTGERGQVMINAAWGLGEAIVGGQVTPDTFVVDRASGKITEQVISEKYVMTVRTPEGTHEEPVPADRRTRAALSPAQAAELARIGMQVEDFYGQPLDIEWALHGGRFFILQARPITAWRGHNQSTGQWNDSLTGDFLWTNGNLGEDGRDDTLHLVAGPDLHDRRHGDIVRRPLPRVRQHRRPVLHEPEHGRVTGSSLRGEPKALRQNDRRGLRAASGRPGDPIGPAVTLACAAYAAAGGHPRGAPGARQPEKTASRALLCAAAVPGADPWAFRPIQLGC